MQGCSRDEQRNNWRCARAVRKRPLRYHGSHMQSFSAGDVMRSPSTLTRVIARMHHAVGPGRQCIALLMPHLPASQPCVAFLICRWIQRCACLGVAIAMRLFMSTTTVPTVSGAETRVMTGIFYNV